MATIVLTAVGTMLGGPVGGAIGAIAGRSIDGAILGSGSREGPRIADLAVTTSSYGQPIARHHGTMRAAGTIIWATDLVEHKDKVGGGKGKPSTTTYSYTISFAVALSSRPIAGIGRIWADGNLLRGAAGDLKVPGMLRIHTGTGDQQPDPLIAAARGAEGCPAFRGCAYAVFEDLALGNYGNRIPALSFEIIADTGAISLAQLVAPAGELPTAAATELAGLVGFANDGGPLSACLQTIDTLYPLSCDARGGSLSVGLAADGAASPQNLPEDCTRAWAEDDFGAENGHRATREAATGERPEALRYYDVDRDYQPGVQRPVGRALAGHSQTIEFPGALHAADAHALIDAAARRSGWQRETLQWRMAEIDPAIQPGSAVRLPDRSGIWLVENWEWRERGVELELVRQNPLSLPASLATDHGTINPPADLQPGATVIAAFSVPQSGYGPDASPTLFAALGVRDGAWLGAALYLDRVGELVPIGRSGRSAATFGALSSPLRGSPALLFEPSAYLDVRLASSGAGFAPATLATLAQGANRLLVGSEVVQFASAEQRGDAHWRLRGLVRGRGGTEVAAGAGHLAGARVVLLDDTLTPLDPALVPVDATTTIAAIGQGDSEPVYAALADPLLGRRPPSPVHPRMSFASDGALVIEWTRRARGCWGWPDQIEVPLVEQAERYRVVLGDPDAPAIQWEVAEPRLVIPSSDLADLRCAFPHAAIQVRQLGDHAPSDALSFGALP